MATSPRRMGCHRLVGASSQQGQVAVPVAPRGQGGPPRAQRRQWLGPREGHADGWSVAGVSLTTQVVGGPCEAAASTTRWKPEPSEEDLVGPGTEVARLCPEGSLRGGICVPVSVRRPSRLRRGRRTRVSCVVLGLCPEAAQGAQSTRCPRGAWHPRCGTPAAQRRPLLSACTAVWEQGAAFGKHAGGDTVHLTRGRRSGRPRQHQSCGQHCVP